VVRLIDNLKGMGLSLHKLRKFYVFIVKF